MSGYVPYKGASLLIDFSGKPHLFAVMNDPCPDGLCLLVMVCSIKPGRKFDGTCVLRKGDHDFIDHDSYCVYRLAYQALAVHIGRMVDGRVYARKADFSPKILARIAVGLHASDETRPAMRRYAEERGI